MKHFDKDARQILTELRADKTEAEFIDLMWEQRYPKGAFPKSGNGWPYGSTSENTGRKVRLVK